MKGHADGGKKGNSIRCAINIYISSNRFKWALAFIWMIVIFYFSAQNGETSSGNNRFIVDIFKKLGLDLTTLIGGSIDFIIRKLAHMTEYFVLMLLIYHAVKKNKNRAVELIIAFAITVGYATTDEIHQYFIPGRACMLRDVGIDSIGALIGVMVILIVIRRKKK